MSRVLNVGLKPMRSAYSVVLLTLLVGCSQAPPPMTDRFFFTGPTPERLACVLVPPFENASSVREIGKSAADAFTESLNASRRFRAMAPDELAKLLEPFGLTNLPLDDVGVARLVAAVIGADSYVQGAVTGIASPDSKEPGMLVIDVRVISASQRHRVLWGATVLLESPLIAQNASFETALSERIDLLGESLQRDVKPRRVVAPESCFYTITTSAERLKSGKESPETNELEASLMDLALVEIPQTVYVPEPALVSTPPTPPVEISAEAEDLANLLEDGVPIELTGVRFAHRRSLRVHLDEPRVALLAEILLSRLDWRIELRVHTNATRDPKADKRLTEAKAKALARKLCKLWSVPCSRVQAQGMGSQTPKENNKRAVGNRRVEVARQKTW